MSKLLYINKKMIRTLEQKGYFIKNTDTNVKIIEWPNNYIQIIEGKNGVLILWRENARHCRRIYAIWPDRRKIRIKIQREDGMFENVIIRA